MKKKEPWVYGKSPDPKNWHEAADALRSLHPKQRKSSGLADRIDALEKLLKEKKEK